MLGKPDLRYHCRIMLTIGVISLFGCLCGGISACEKEWQKKVYEVVKKLDADGESQNYREKMLKYYTDTVRVLLPGHPAVIGKKELREFSKEMVNTWRMYTTTMTAENVVIHNDEIAVVWTKFILTEKEDLGRIAEKGLMMLKKVDGEAKIDLDIWNFDSPTRIPQANA